MKKLLIAFLTLALAFPFALPISAQANTTIRQEINILDHNISVTTASSTSNEQVQLDATQYATGTISYYFEVVYKTSATVTSTITLQRVSSTTNDATITTATSSTSYTRVRSSAFTPPSGQTSYDVQVGSVANGTVNVQAARIIVIENATSLTNTETQIEIGDYDTGNANTATSSGALTNPKYWQYNSSSWDGSPTFYAEVTYAIPTANILTASTSLFTTPGNATWTSPSDVTSVTVNVWGAGGAGLDASAAKGGGGGGGAAFVSSTLPISASTAYSIKVATGSLESVRGASSSFGGSWVWAEGGGTPAADLVSSTRGLASNSSGTTKFDGGNGGVGNDTNDVSGGGGGSGGPDGAGVIGASSSGTSGGNGGAGDNTSGGAGGNGGNAVDGSNGTANALGGGGGGGGGNGSGGGRGGAPGAGGGGGEVCTPPQCQGAEGQVKLFYNTSIATNATATIILQKATSSFVWTDNTVIASSTNTTSTRVRVSFTPTSTYFYRIVGMTANASITYDIYNAKIVVDSGVLASGGLNDSYSETNQSAELTMDSNNFQGIGQSFTSTGGTLDKVSFYLKKQNSPTTGTAKIYSHSGTYGVSSVPGTLLATSDVYDVSTLTTSFQVITFTFSGANKISLSASTNYVVAFEYSATANPNSVLAGYDSTSPTHSGNSVFSTGSYTANNTIDVPFYVYTDVVAASSPTLLEPQYLLANTKLAAGTAAQNFLTSWDSTEWSTTNAYVEQVDAIGGSTSSVKLIDSGGSLITGSTIANPSSTATSTLTMPCAAGNIDSQATVNNNDLYSTRILVGVGGSANACIGGANTFSAKIWFSTATKTAGQVKLQ